LHNVPQERQGVEKVALARGVAADKDGQRLQRHVTERDALVAANPHAAQERRLRLGEAVGGNFVTRCSGHGLGPFVQARWRRLRLPHYSKRLPLSSPFALLFAFLGRLAFFFSCSPRRTSSA